MNQRILPVFALSCLLALVTPLAALDAGSTPPDFTVKLEGGSTFQLSALKGKVVLIDFWASWCPPCRASVPDLVALNQAMKGKAFRLLGISLDRDMEKGKAFIAEQKMAWLHVLDKAEGARLAGLYGVQYIPSTFLIDKQGKVAGVNLHGEELKAAVEKLLKQ